MATNRNQSAKTIKESLDVLLKGGHGKHPAKIVKHMQEAAGLSMVAAARRYAPAAMATLFSILLDETAGLEVKRKAANDILDRAYGKAPQLVDVIKRIDQSDVERVAAAILAKREKARIIDAPVLGGPKGEGEGVPPGRVEGVGGGNRVPSSQNSLDDTSLYTECSDDEGEGE